MSPATVICPTCGRELEWAGAAFRPFCSERCRLIDLGAWFSDQRSIPGESAPPDATPAADDPGELRRK
ncbi:MAG TPA: DNA gyrase inhibitor YacG [Steroidobacteraceae bacterium]|jgi:hypothetical protein